MLAYNTLFLGIDISQNYAFNNVVTCIDPFYIYAHVYICNCRNNTNNSFKLFFFFS